MSEESEFDNRSKISYGPWVSSFLAGLSPEGQQLATGDVSLPEMIRRKESSMRTIDYAAMNAGEFLQTVGTDAQKWADAFRQIDPPLNPDTLTSWFANAIMAGHDQAVQARHDEKHIPDHNCSSRE